MPETIQPMPIPPQSRVSVAVTDILMGTDIVSIDRVRENYQRYGERFFLKMLTRQELEYCQSGNASQQRIVERVAGRIAAKEAVAKALTVGLNGLGYTQGVDWHDIEVVSRPNQPPQIKCHQRAAQIAHSANITTWRLSLSHHHANAIATALALVSVS